MSNLVICRQHHLPKYCDNSNVMATSSKVFFLEKCSEINEKCTSVKLYEYTMIRSQDNREEDHFWPRKILGLKNLGKIRLTWIHCKTILFDSFGFNTQHSLLTLVENWRKRLDNKGFGGAILMDLSKAFDTLNNDLLIAKLHAYGFEHDALKLLHSYLSKRWHRTKVNTSFSS